MCDNVYTNDVQSHITEFINFASACYHSGCETSRRSATPIVASRTTIDPSRFTAMHLRAKHGVILEREVVVAYPGRLVLAAGASALVRRRERRVPA